MSPKARSTGGGRRVTARDSAQREEAAIRELDRVRRPLMEELERLTRKRDYYRGQPRHTCCTREHNRMRISPLEARAIARAFRSDPSLRKKLPSVLAKLARELRELTDGEERQGFDCPLLEGTRCLVHRAAKPIGCTAWHPPPRGEDATNRRGRSLRRGQRSIRHSA